MYSPNDNKQNRPFCKKVVEKCLNFLHGSNQSKFDKGTQGKRHKLWAPV